MLQSLKSKIIAVFIVAVIAAAAYTAGSGMFFNSQKASAQAALLSPDTVSTIFNSASPAVVEIDVSQQSTGIFGGSSQGQGSGFLIDTNGDILTNNHVVEGATSVSVKFKSGNTVSATVSGTDAVDDLAIVKVPTSAISGITPLTMADSSAVVSGQIAIAIGAPYGLDETVTVGVISGLNRTVSGSNMRNMLQTDAALNPGNSGGPLLDVNGNVVGINTAIETGVTGTGANGIGFAVPSNVAASAIPNLEAGKTIARPWLGISGTTLTQSLAQQLNLTVNQGVYVVSVVSGSPAATAGLKGSNLTTSGTPAAGGDVITAADGKAMNTIDDLTSYISSKNVGDTVTLSILRGGSTISVPVTLGTFPSNLNASGVPQITPGTTPQASNAPGQLPNMPGRFHFRGSVPSTN